MIMTAASRVLRFNVRNDKDAFCFLFYFMTCKVLNNNRCTVYPTCAEDPGSGNIAYLKDAIPTERVFVERLLRVSPGVVTADASLDPDGSIPIRAEYVPKCSLLVKLYLPCDAEDIQKRTSLFDELGVMIQKRT